MPRTQKYLFFVYFGTIFVFFETPWAMNRHFMSKKKRAHSGDLTLTVAALDDTTRRIENHLIDFVTDLYDQQRVPAQCDERGLF